MTQRSIDEKRVSEAEYLHIADEDELESSSSCNANELNKSKFKDKTHRNLDANNNINNLNNDHNDDKTNEASDEITSQSSSVRQTTQNQNNSKLTTNLLWTVIASTGASFQHGYNGGVINAPEKLLSQFINETYTLRHNQQPSDSQIDLILATIVSVFCIGGFIGALATAAIGDKFGRKEGLLYNNAIVIIAAPLMISAKPLKSYELLIFGRFIIGINAGLNAGLAPLYINEISPSNWRGALGSVYQIVITTSILVSNIFGCPSFFGTQDAWPLLFAVPLVPAAFMLLTLQRCVESPRHLLLIKNKELEAQRALSWLRETVDVHVEMETLLVEHEQSKQLASQQFSQMFVDKKLRKPLTIAIIIMLSQQLSGINAILYYSTSIFRSASLSETSAMNATLGLSLLNVLVTFGSALLVEKVGRKKLQLTGLMGMCVSCVILALCLDGFDKFESITNLIVNQTTTSKNINNSFDFRSSTSVLAIYIFIVMFAIGPGSIPWFVVNELFPARARSFAASVSVSANWLANFVVLLAFLPLTDLLHGYTFFVFAALLLILYSLTYLMLPETKGASAEEIEALFQDDNNEEYDDENHNNNNITNYNDSTTFVERGQ